MALFTRPAPVKAEPKPPDVRPGPSTAFTGTAVSIVLKGSMYVPVMLTIQGGIVAEVDVGNADVYQGAEIKAGVYLRKKAKG